MIYQLVPLSMTFRSRHYCRLNISQTVQGRDIVAVKY